MNPHDYLIKKYNIKTDVIEIPHTGRNQLADFIHDLGFKTGVEVGVAAGEYSEALMYANPQMKLYGIDPYVRYHGYRDYTRNTTFNRLLEEARARLDKFPNYEFIREFSVEASKDFADGSLDFVYIDGNHSEPYVSQDLNAWFPKVRKGGVFAGHDYARIRSKHGEPSTNWVVIQALEEFLKDKDLQLYIWGLEAKLPGLIRDDSRSWMLLP